MQDQKHLNGMVARMARSGTLNTQRKFGRIRSLTSMFVETVEKSLKQTSIPQLQLAHLTAKTLNVVGQYTVYDIEVEDTHTFFGNDILVHNSIYVRMDNILKLLFKTTKIDWYDKETFAKIKYIFFFI